MSLNEKSGAMSRSTKLRFVQFAVLLAGALVSLIASAAGQPATDPKVATNDDVLAELRRLGAIVRTSRVGNHDSHEINVQLRPRKTN
jgi:hypothetical protein